jgi:hypothetical protein
MKFGPSPGSGVLTAALAHKGTAAIIGEAAGSQNQAGVDRFIPKVKPIVNVRIILFFSPANYAVGYRYSCTVVIRNPVTKVDELRDDRLPLDLL